MPYDAIIEEIKTVPQNRLSELQAFIGYLKFSSPKKDEKKAEKSFSKMFALADASDAFSFHEKFLREELHERGV